MSNVFLCQEQTIGKMTVTITLFTLASKNMNYIAINLIKDVQDLYTENYKSCWEKLKKS